MKTALECLAMLAITVLGARAEETTYSRIADVEGLGTIAFPVGKWSLEMQALQTASEAMEKPDYFVFKKLDGPLERLTFLRYNPLIAPKDAAAREKAVQGFARLSLSQEEQKMDGEKAAFQFLGKPATVNRDTSFSWLRIPPKPEPPWRYHAGLYPANQWAIGVIRASTTVTDPHTLENVYIISKFTKRVPKGMLLIPPELAGDWRGPEVDHQTPLFHLAENGDCKSASATSDEILSGDAEGFYLPAERILVLDDERFRYDGKTLTLIPKKNASSWIGPGVYEKWEPPKDLFGHETPHAPRRINEGNTLKYEEVDMR